MIISAVSNQSRSYTRSSQYTAFAPFMWHRIVMNTTSESKRLSGISVVLQWIH